MIKHSLSSTAEFALLRFHLIWTTFLSISATMININSMFLQKQTFSLVSMTVIDVDSMFLQKQTSFLISVTIINLDSMFLQELTSFQVSATVINLNSMFLQKQMMFWNHHWDFSSTVKNFFKVWKTLLILFANINKLMIFSNDLMTILSWFLMLRVLNCWVKMMSVNADWLEKFFKSSLMYAKSWMNSFSSALISFS